MSAPICGKKAFGMMPPCVLAKGHSGDCEDGFGGHYSHAPVPVPATQSACKLRRKLRALAERGVAGERDAAIVKLAALEKRYDFSQADEFDAKGSLFDGQFYPARGEGREVCAFRADEIDIAGFAKWAVEIKTGIACGWRGESLFAEVERESTAGIVRIVETILESFAALWREFDTLAQLGAGARRCFMLGLFDGMMSDERKTGVALPSWSPPRKRKVKAGKRAVVNCGVSIHPYTAALELGARIRCNVPIADLTAYLRDEVLRIAA